MVRYFFEFKPGRVFRIGRNSSFSKWTDSTKVATLVVEGKTRIISSEFTILAIGLIPEEGESLEPVTP